MPLKAAGVCALYRTSSRLGMTPRLESSQKAAASRFTIYATWCPPCKMIGPIFEKMAPGISIEFLKVDVDELPETSASFGIQSVPTFLFTQDGDVMGQCIGADEGGIRGELDKLK